MWLFCQHGLLLSFFSKENHLLIETLLKPSRLDGSQLYLHLSNAAPEWKAGSFRWRSGALVVACPLKGPVGHADTTLKPHGN